MTKTDSQTLQVKDLPVYPPRDKAIDDHAYMKQVMRLGPLVCDGYFGVHTFSHQHMLDMLSDDLTRQLETEGIDLLGIGAGAIRDFFANVMLFSNGTVHRNRRAPLARAFAFPIVKVMRADIRAAATAIIKPLLGGGEVDFLADVAGPMPARIIAGILGVPERDIPHFTTLVYSSIRVLASRSRGILLEAEADLARLNTYVAGVLADRAKSPQQDFLSAYLARVADSALDPTEVRVQIVGLILAGSDTTRSSIATTFARLLDHQDQWEMFKADPDALKADVTAEGLRYDPVVGSLSRIAAQDFMLAGVRIPTGSVLFMSMIAALRDPAIYADPDRFNITRKDHPALHPAFGGGGHRCLGEALARVEIEETLSVLAELAPNARLIGPVPTLRGLTGVRGINGMTVALG